MNRENIEYMKSVMEQAQAASFHMKAFQHNTSGEYEFAETVDQLHQCGNTACFAGYLAISEKFKQDGGRTRNGVPVYRSFDDYYAVAEWLGICNLLADKIVYGSYNFYDDLFDVPFDEVRPAHLIQVMDMILDGTLK